MAFRIVMGSVPAPRQEELNTLWDELFTSGPGTFSVPLRPANSQGPATHYGFNAAGTKPAQADVMAALADGTLPEEIWANGEPTGVAPAWGQGNLPSEAAAQASLAGLTIDNVAGATKPGIRYPGFLGGLDLEIGGGE